MSADLSQQLPQVGSFLEAIEPLLPAYRYALLSYVAVVYEGEPVILRAGLRCSVEAPPLPRRINNQPLSLRAGQRHFENLELTVRSIETWVRAAVSDQRLPCEDPPLKLRPEATRRYTAYHETTQASHVQLGERAELLQLSGAGRDFISGRQIALERELNEVGYDSFEQLMRTFGLRPSEQTSFDISIAPVAKIDSTSQLQGTRLQLAVRLARGLDREKLRITVRDADLSRAPLPYSFVSSELDWTERDGYLIGSLSFNLGTSAVVICRAVYAGRIQHDVRLADPQAFPNPRRVILQVIDPELQRLRKLLTYPTDKQRDDYETSVGLLLQVLGFAPAPFGKLSGMTGQPDLFVESADGQMLVVEVTTDVPDDDKLMKLVSRTARARDELRRALGGAAPSVAAVLICPLPPEELRPIRTKAAEFDVMILCRPEIEAAIARTEFSPDSREVLRQWRSLPLTQVLSHGLDGRQ
jgi:hypothetical protein